MDTLLHRWNLVGRSAAVHLATNQQSHRARHISELIGYRDLFNREFYSCQIGFAKPDVDLFKFILSELAFPPRSVLLIDHREENVASAIAASLHASLLPAAGGATAMRTILARFGL